MKANKAHLDQEYQNQRIRGNDYATVYLGSLTSVLQFSLEFVLQRRKLALEATLLEQQIELAKLEQEKARAEIALANKDLELKDKDLDLKDVDLRLKEKELEFMPIELEIKQADLENRKKEVAIKEKQLEMLPVEIALKQAEVDLKEKEVELMPVELGIKQAEQANREKEVEIKTKQLEFMPVELDIKRGELQIKNAEVEIKKEEVKLVPEQLNKLKAETGLIKQNTANALTQNDTLLREQCNLAAQYEILVTNNLKGNAEIGLLNQKIATEKAQTQGGASVDVDSIIGRQKDLYRAQTEGYIRNAEQEVGKLMLNTWNTRRTTDDGTSANTTNRLDDGTIGAVVTKLLQGIKVS